MKIYISGPITGKPLDQARADFAAAAEEIVRRGHEAVNPCMLQNILNPETTSWEQYMKAALGLLRASDALLMLPGWDKSTGAQIEHHKGVYMYGQKVFYSIDEVPQITEG